MLVFVNIETASSQMKKKIHAYKFMVQVKEKSFKVALGVCFALKSWKEYLLLFHIFNYLSLIHI